MSKNREKAILTQIIVQLIRDRKPRNVKQLVSLIKKETSFPESRIIEQVIQLQSQGKIVLEESTKPVPRKLNTYLRSREAAWFWITLALATATAAVVLAIPENAPSLLVYIRYLLGIIFVMWLPGYGFVKTLFPREPPFKASSASLDSIIRIALSIGMSLALVPIVGLLLYYSPWGMGLEPTVLSLLTMTVTFATVGIIREHQSQLQARETA